MVFAVWLWAGSLALLSVLFGVTLRSPYAMDNGTAQRHPLDATLKWKKAMLAQGMGARLSDEEEWAWWRERH